MYFTITRNGNLLIEATTLKDSYELGLLSEQLREVSATYESDCSDAEESKPYIRIPLAPEGFIVPQVNVPNLTVDSITEDEVLESEEEYTT